MIKGFVSVISLFAPISLAVLFRWWHNKGCLLLCVVLSAIRPAEQTWVQLSDIKICMYNMTSCDQQQQWQRFYPKFCSWLHEYFFLCSFFFYFEKLSFPFSSFYGHKQEYSKKATTQQGISQGDKIWSKQSISLCLRKCRNTWLIGMTSMLALTDPIMLVICWCELVNYWKVVVLGLKYIYFFQFYASRHILYYQF